MTTVVDPLTAQGPEPMTDQTDGKTADDPVAVCVLDCAREHGSVSLRDIAQAFAGPRRKPADPRDHWRKYMTAVRQQVIALARQGRIEIVRKGRVVEPDEMKGLVRIRLPERGGIAAD